MTKKILYVPVFLLLGISAAAQNLDPTIEVSRDYRGKLVEVHKPVPVMTVPDSVTRFDLDFDYSVFDRPYKGTYEFSPFVMAMRPEDTAERQNVFYLNAGLGYSLHPAFDLVWEPRMKKTKGKYAMSLYAVHRSYVGNYRTYGTPLPDAEKVVFKSLHPFRDNKVFGYDCLTNVGTLGRLDYKGGFLGYDVSYLGIHRELPYSSMSTNGLYNALDVKFHVGSISRTSNAFVYDLKFNYRYFNDLYGIKSGADLDGNELHADIALGGQFKQSHSVIVDFDVDYVNYRQAGGVASGASFTVVPHYVFAKGRWHIDAGVKASFNVSNDKAVLYGAGNQYVYPDVHLSFAAIREAMSIYAGVTGGNDIYSYSGLLERDHRFNAAFYRTGGCLIDSEIERVNTSLGLKGRIANCFTYDLKGGYALYGNTVFEGVSLLSALQAVYGYSASQKAYVSLDWSLNLPMVEFDGGLSYSHFWNTRGSNMDGLFLPARLTGDIAVTYNWKKRIYAGVDCVFATARKGSLHDGTDSFEAVVPGFADLGVNFEYRLNRKLSLWLRGGNLLNMDVQYNLLHAESGINCTIGARLCF